MLRNKFNRHTIAFLTIALASLLLYPAALAGTVVFTLILLGLIIIAAFLTLITK